MSRRNAARGRTRDVRHCDGATQVRWPPAGPAPLVDEGLERALAEEMTGHLGYEKHDPAGRGSGNSRNGPICLICAVAGLPELDLSAAQIGGYTRVLSLWINHALRSASDVKAAGAMVPRVRA